MNIKNIKYCDSKIYLSLFVIIAILKLALVSCNEIIAIPNDSTGYVVRSLSISSLEGLDYQLVGYPIWLFMSRLVGLPQRISIEVLYIISCTYCILSFSKLLNKKTIFIIYGIVIFNPFTFYLFNLALTDGYFLCLMIIALGISFNILLSDLNDYIHRYFILGFICGIAIITRLENYFIYSWIGILYLFLYIKSKGEIFNKKNIKFIAVSFLLIVIPIGLVTSLEMFVHYKKDGVYARSMMMMESHMKMLRQLASIESNQEFNFVPITRASMEMAAAVSPHFARFNDYVKSPSNSHVKISEGAGFPAGEIAAAWVGYTFLNARGYVLPNSSNLVFNDYFVSVNKELDNAFENGLLKKKFIINPFLGAFHKKLDLLPSAIWKSLKSSFIGIQFMDRDYPGTSSDIFDAGCLRRTALVKNDRLRSNRITENTDDNCKLLFSLQSNMLNLVSNSFSYVIFFITPLLIYILALSDEIIFKRKKLNYNLLIIQGFLTFVIMSRILYYSLIEAYAYPPEPRYWAASQFFFIIFSILSYYILLFKLFNGIKIEINFT